MATSKLPSAAGSDSEDDDPVPLVPQKSQRLRTCAAGVSNFWKDVVDTVLPPPPPPPSKLTRKEKVKKREHAQAESMRKRLVRAGVNLAECGLSNLSDKRLHDFYEKLDESKRRIFVKAPKVAAITAAKLFEEFTRLQFAKVQLPWGMKRGHTVPASVKLTADPPYDPDDPTPKAGYLRFTVEQEGGFLGPEVRSVYLSGVVTTNGTDNVVQLNTMNNVGNVMIVCDDEPSRWKWFCAVNAGLHRVAAARMMLDQGAAILPWHDKAIIETETND